MFGHERGAFTGATERRLGRFELAHGGTLFLDEVGDLSAEAQAKLLRTLETGELQRHRRRDARSGSTCAIVAATNRRLEDAVADGDFREDLFFRLNVFPIHLPPLRERLEDLPALVAHLAERVRPAPGAGVHAERARGAGRLRLAGQRARAGQPRRAAQHPERPDGGRAPRCARCSGAAPSAAARRRRRSAGRSTRRWTTSSAA